MMVWYITPWHGQTAHLLPEYIKAVKGGRVVAIDNCTPHETMTALNQAAEENDWALIQNSHNVGFAPANNQGFNEVNQVLQPDDIVCFINSDVRADGLTEALKGNVKHGALYGPSLARQMVLGKWVPYIEGWCIAATAQTWFDLTDGNDTVWPEEYATAYWEDNALSLRALDTNINLVHLALPIQHIGGQSGGIEKMGEVLERNRAIFVEEARQLLPDQPTMTPVRQRYLRELQTDSDIRNHLPLLYASAKKLVVELGTRSGVSTAAFLAGVEVRGGHVVSIDLADVSSLYRGHPQWTCIQGDSRHTQLPMMIRNANSNQLIDVLLIDTDHTYEQVTAELLLWSEHVKPGGMIFCHDTETFPGVRAAVEDWVNGEAPEGTTVTFVLPNNGMGVITLGGN